MWILPKNHRLYCLFAPATEESNSVLSECLEKSPSSLMWRSKPSPLRTWSLRWKKDSWFRRLCGRMLRPSLWPHFEDGLTSLLAAIHASPSVPPGSGSEKMIPVTSGPGYSTSLTGCSPECASSRMSMGTYPKGCDESCPTWKAEVTRRRGEYSRRLKSALHTSGNGCSSWPAVPVPTGGRKPAQPMSRTGITEDGKKRQVGLENAVNWGTPRVTTNNGCPSPQCTGKGSRLEDQVAGPPAQESRNTSGSRREQCDAWQTPSVSTGMHRQADGSMTAKLDGQVKAWSAPQCHDVTGRPMGPSNKLNPRWVETLMGLPIGWTSIGTDSRVDELRLLGNGVVPQTAEKAFRTLLKELAHDPLP